MAKRETDSVLIKKKLEQMLPNMQFSVNNESYANGHTVRIGIKGGNVQPYTKPEDHTTRYTLNEYWYKEDNNLTPEIKEIITKVIDIALSIDSGFLSRHSSSSLRVVLGVSTKTKSEPYIYSPSKTPTSKSSGDSSKFSKGELLRECAGWEIYKKTLPNDRIVYSAFKNKQTKPNKEDWNTIKSEVYLQSGFKYGRFGNFEKWGSMTANDENLILNALCEVLTKYYGSTTPITTDKPVDIYINGEFFSAVPNEMEAVIMLGAKYGGKKYNEMLTAGKIVKTSDRRLDVTEVEPTTDEAIDIYLDGKFFQKANSQENASEIMSDEFGATVFGAMALDGLVKFDNEEKKLWVFRYNFDYGKNLGVPKEYGNLLQLYLAEKGFKVYVSNLGNGRLVIFKTLMATDGIIIGDFDGEFNLNEYGDYNKVAGSVNYLIDKTPLSPLTMADSIKDIYDNYFPNSKQDEPTPTDKEKLTKAIAGLEILAAKGNEKAQKAIIGLKYILNK
jgi:hypothetical protein